MSKGIHVYIIQIICLTHLQKAIDNLLIRLDNGIEICINYH